MNFVFENYTNLGIFDDPYYNLVMAISSRTGNFLKSNTSYHSGNTRFKFSDFVSRLFEVNSDKEAKAFSLENKPTNYVISTGVAHHPVEWAGKPFAPAVTNLFDLLNKDFLTDLQNNNAILLIDQSHEGYQTPWLWDFFHDSCQKHSIPLRAVVYVTGNQDAARLYDEWLNQKGLGPDKIKVIPVAIFDKFIMDRASYLNYNFNFNDLLKYKEEQVRSIRLFDCLNRGTYRRHRIENYFHLVKAGLNSKGHITMPVIDSFSVKGFDAATINKAKQALPLLLPKEFSSEGSVFNRILTELYKNTWVSLVTEASYYKKESTTFISEKIYKPVICLQPFIVVGSKGVLKKFRELGYKTFHPFIDESYDEADDTQRFIKIIDAIEKIDRITDKVSWYKSLQPILEHNRAVLQECQHTLTSPFTDFKEYYKEYFKLC